jgi:sarcosine oxidase subunit beta
MQKSYDAIIIGAGIIGCSIAYEMARRGRKTLNVDTLPAAGYGSTSNSCAVIRIHYSTLEGTAIAYESYTYWDRWADHLGVKDESGIAKFYKTGILVFKSKANDNLANVKALLEKLDIAYEEWDYAKIRVRFPIIDDASYYPPKRPEDPLFGKKNAQPLPGAIYYAEGGYISDPQLSTHNVQVAAEAHGAKFRFNAKVVDILKSDNRVEGVLLDDGTTLEAPVVVNASGPHSFVINRLAGVEAGMKIKTRALRHEVVHLPAPAGFDYESVGCPASDSDVGAYWRPEVGNHILSGSEDPDCDPKQWIDDPDDFNRDLTGQAKAQAYRLALRIPDVGIPRKFRGVVDLYDVTDDWIPIYDKSDLPGFYMAVGTSGNQYKNAPVVGKMMAELIDKCETGHDHDADPISFHLDHLRMDVSLKFFSRLREINPESSFSVLG